MKIKQTVSRWLMICGKVIKFSAKRYAGNQQAKQAIVLTYYTLFSIVPMAALLFGIAKGLHWMNSCSMRFMTVFPIIMSLLITSENLQKKHCSSHPAGWSPESV